jgi:hypothetical protein
VDRVPVEQVGHVAEDREPPGRLGRVAAVAEMAGQRGQPGLAHRVPDHVDQRPHRPLGPPRIPLGVDPGGGRHRVADHPTREGEADVGADAERRGHALGQPPLHPARRHRDDLGRERVRERVGQDGAQAFDQAVRPFSAMDLQHACSRSMRDAGL